MSKALGLTNIFSLNFAGRKPSAARAVSQPQPWLSLVSAFFVAMNIVLLASYLIGVNEFSAKGYEIKQLQNAISQLSEENGKLSVQVAETSSMVSIQSGFEETGFVPALSAVYLQANQYSKK